MNKEIDELFGWLKFNISTIYLNDGKIDFGKSSGMPARQRYLAENNEAAIVQFINTYSNGKMISFERDKKIANIVREVHRGGLDETKGCVLQVPVSEFMPLLEWLALKYFYPLKMEYKIDFINTMQEWLDYCKKYIGYEKQSMELIRISSSEYWTSGDKTYHTTDEKRLYYSADAKKDRYRAYSMFILSHKLAIGEIDEKKHNEELAILAIILGTTDVSDFDLIGLQCETEAIEREEWEKNNNLLTDEEDEDE